VISKDNEVTHFRLFESMNSFLFYLYYYNIMSFTLDTCLRTINFHYIIHYGMLLLTVVTPIILFVSKIAQKRVVSFIFSSGEEEGQGRNNLTRMVCI